jgi:hypothetical protein
MIQGAKALAHDCIRREEREKNIMTNNNNDQNRRRPNDKVQETSCRFTSFVNIFVDKR